uniref:hypothetical protein n=1 Tax=Streptomyces hawaiiensis TaxID=67305 RepID=UPI0031D66585
MDDHEDRILADELAALAAAAGAWGGLTRFVAKLMSKNVHEIDLVVALPFEDAVEHVASVLERAGRTVGPVPEAGADQRMIRVVVGGGAGGLNPVVVTARVTNGGASDAGPDPCGCQRGLDQTACGRADRCPPCGFAGAVKSPRRLPRLPVSTGVWKRLSAAGRCRFRSVAGFRC